MDAPQKNKILFYLTIVQAPVENEPIVVNIHNIVITPNLKDKTTGPTLPPYAFLYLHIPIPGLSQNSDKTQA